MHRHAVRLSVSVGVGGEPACRRSACGWSVPSYSSATAGGLWAGQKGKCGCCVRGKRLAEERKAGQRRAVEMKNTVVASFGRLRPRRIAPGEPCRRPSGRRLASRPPSGATHGKSMQPCPCPCSVKGIKVGRLRGACVRSGSGPNDVSDRASRPLPRCKDA